MAKKKVEPLTPQQEKLAEDNYKLIFKCANYWKKKLDLPFEDCYDDCAESYMRSVRKFNPDLGWKFSTFYYTVAKSSMWKVMRDKRAQKRAANLNTLSTDKVMGFHPDGSDITLMDMLKSKSSLNNDFDKIALNESLAKLEERERICIELMYFKEVRQKDISALMGFTQAHVSRTIRSGLEKMRNELEEKKWRNQISI